MSSYRAMLPPTPPQRHWPRARLRACGVTKTRCRLGSFGTPPKPNFDGVLGIPVTRECQSASVSMGKGVDVQMCLGQQALEFAVLQLQLAQPFGLADIHTPYLACHL